MSKADMYQYINFVKTAHPSIKFTAQANHFGNKFGGIINIMHTQSQSAAHVLVPLFTKIPQKPMVFSCTSPPTPKSWKTSIPYSQLLRLCCMCQDYHDFLGACEVFEMVDFFYRRAYPVNSLSLLFCHITQLARQISFNTRPALDQTNLILIFHPHLLAVKEIFFRHLSPLKSDQITCEAFPDGHGVIYRGDKLLMAASPRLPSWAGIFLTHLNVSWPWVSRVGV